MTSRKHLKETEYKQIKALLDVKLSFSQIKKVTGKSWNTVNFIKQSKSFDEYHEIVKNAWKKYHPVSPVLPTTPTNGKVKVGSPEAISSQLNTIISVLKSVEWKLDNMKGGEHHG
jgi:hypothetical protein